MSLRETPARRVMRQYVVQRLPRPAGRGAGISLQPSLSFSGSYCHSYRWKMLTAETCGWTQGFTRFPENVPVAIPAKSIDPLIESLSSTAPANDIENACPPASAVKLKAILPAL
jgi:hypothetical protein